MREFERIASVQALLDKLNEEPHTMGEFFIKLNGGGCSWKGISLADNGKIYVLNEIDESEEFIDIAELDSDKHNIGKAIKNGALYFGWF